MVNSKIADGSATRNGIELLRDSQWAVAIDRAVIERLCNKEDFGALVAFAAVCSWRDRGQGWFVDEARVAASTPPGGWPALAGCTAPTWRAWRDRAIELDLLEYRNGKVKGRRPVKLLGTIYGREKGAQFARLPISILCDPGLSRTARRCYVALALFRRVAKGGEEAWACASVGTIARLAGYKARSIAQCGLRELVKAGALIDPAPGHATTRARRYLMPADYPPTAKLKVGVAPLSEAAKLKAQVAPGESVGSPKLKAQVAQTESVGSPLKSLLQESNQESSSARARADAPFEGAPITPAELGKLSRDVLKRRRPGTEVGLQQDEDGESPSLELRTFGVTSKGNSVFTQDGVQKPKPRSCAGFTNRQLDEAIVESQNLLADLSVPAPSITSGLKELKAERADRQMEKVAA